MLHWIDTHCHLDAPEFTRAGAQAWEQMRARAFANGVVQCVLPAVEVANFDAVRRYAHGAYGDQGENGEKGDNRLAGNSHKTGENTVPDQTDKANDVYALGLHPLYIKDALVADLTLLDEQLAQHHNDSRLVAVGEIGR